MSVHHPSVDIMLVRTVNQNELHVHCRTQDCGYKSVSKMNKLKKYDTIQRFLSPTVETEDGKASDAAIEPLLCCEPGHRLNL